MAAARRWPGGLAFQDLVIGLGLLLSILAVYAQVSQFDFVNFDDDLYVSQNARVQAGLTPASIAWAFTAVTSSNWQPVTLLSHMLDVQFFGLHSGIHHLVNVVYHALSALLLFALLQRATKARAASAFVAFVFALHPLHVESVAWMAERKDVLSTFFFFLALYAYVLYTEHPTVKGYLWMLAAFVMGLLSKPMVVTFPFVLLLFDVWPLRRVQLPKILWEKLPLVALSAASSAVAYWVQRTTGAVAVAIPLDGRIAKALLSYITYIRQTLWPTGLAVFYPYPQQILASRIGAALLVLLGVSVVVLFSWRRRPYLATGWFWYLGTLVPVIGLVKVGQQSHADRYTYLPMVGLSIMVAWGAAEVVGRWPRTRSVIAAAACLISVACLVLTWKQTTYWQNSETLYERAIDVTGDNWLAQANLGAYLMNLPDRSSDAIDHLETALRLQPENAEADNNLGLCLSRAELCGAAIPHFETALRNKPDLVAARNNLGNCFTRNGNYAAATEQLETALHMRPDYPEAHFNLAMTLAKIPGRETDAIAHYQVGLRLSPGPPNPGIALAHRNLAELLLNAGRTADAISHLEEAQRIHSDPETLKILERLGVGRN